MAAACGGAAKLIDPVNDAVFRSRKAFYRRLWERLSDKDDAYAPHQLIAEEHSAQLNDTSMARAMSRNEAYELRFRVEDAAGHPAEGSGGMADRRREPGRGFYRLATSLTRPVQSFGQDLGGGVVR